MSESGHWLHLPGGAEVDTIPEEAARVLTRLAHARAIHPGAPVPETELAPEGSAALGARPAEELAAAIATLHRLGLADVLVERPEGWLLDPSVDFALALRRG